MEDEKLSAFALKVWSYKQGEVVALMIHLGDRLGLYGAMAGRGPVDADELARCTGLDSRWLLEWLRCQGAAGLLDTEDGRSFSLSEEGAEVLANESVWFAAGAFSGAAFPPELIEPLADAFRTGRGLSYDEQGPSVAHTVERLTDPWTRLVLVPRILPSLSGVVDRLREGARVADIGCGSGVALVAMASAFPASRFEGYDPSAHALVRAREKVAEAGLTNVILHQAPATELPPAPTFDFVLTLDCIHDMPRPADAIAAIYKSVKPDGTWLIKDIRGCATWEENRENPVLALMYGISVATCMSSALSEPGGAGLGTLGFHPQVAEKMCREAGFTQFTLHDFDDPTNLYYEVRP